MAKMLGLTEVLSLSLLLSLTAAFSLINKTCEQWASQGNCSFYPKCVEKRIPCGPDGYALGYAGKYCVRFTEAIPKFTLEVRDSQSETRPYIPCSNLYSMKTLIVGPNL